MRRVGVSLVVGLLLCASGVTAQQPAEPQPAKAKATAPEIPYDSLPNVYKMPAGLYMGEGIGVATSSKGSVYIFTRSGESRVFEFDPQRELRQGVRQGQLRLRLRPCRPRRQGRQRLDGRRRHERHPQVQPGRQAADGARQAARPHRSADMRCRARRRSRAPTGRTRSIGPTDIAWDPQGNIFVSDGYTDSRVVKYDKNGRFIKSAGTRGNGDLQFSTPHTIAGRSQGQRLRRRPRQPPHRRPRQRPQSEGSLGRTSARPWGICVSLNGPEQYLYTSNSIGTTLDERLEATTGEIYKMKLDGTVVGRFGKAGKALKEFASIHQLDCREPERRLHRRDSGLARPEDHAAPGQDDAAVRPRIGRQP